MIPVTSIHTATLTVPLSGNQADAIHIMVAPDGRSVAFSATGDTPAQARDKIRGFLDDAAAAAKAP